MPWRVAITGRAARDLDAVPTGDRAAIERAIEALPEGMASADLKKLAGRRDEWRLRVGRWRVLMRLDKGPGLITIRRVLPRDKAYRD